MSLKTIAHKAKVGYGVFREMGLIAFLIVLLQFVQKHTDKRYRGKAVKLYSKAWLDIITGPSKSRKSPKKRPKTQSMTLNWLMPPPGKGSGGHVTIFRFIQALENAGHTCRIYLHNAGPKSDVNRVREIMGDSFPAVKASMKWLKLGEEMDEADGVFATSWETAYSVNVSGAAFKKFYFVQDFEPYFYPVGSQSVLAENTYRLGFFGVTAGAWLAKKLKTDYGMRTDYITFGSDSGIYKYQNNSVRKEVLFYARPYTERRGFELGLMALEIFHRRHPDYAINMVGYDVSKYRINFPYNNLKILEHQELNEVYNRCAAGLLLSLTNMSLLPLELLSSGCIPVINDAENNRLVSDNPYLAYSDCTPAALADKMSEVIAKNNLIEFSKQASISVQNDSWEESGKKFVEIVKREIDGK